MSPRSTEPITSKADAELRRVSHTFGTRVRDARLARGWTVMQLAKRAGLSRDMVYRAEAGAPVSSRTAARLGVGLERRLEIELVDPRRKSSARPSLSVDAVHSAMGELEATHLKRLQFRVGIDEPYQHFQFAGRADVVAWDLERRALLHLENRTRFPDFQEMAGVYNAKRAYLGAALAERVGVSRWASETHVLVALWSSETLHVLRLRKSSFAALCPDEPEALHRWWSGDPPTRGARSIVVVMDPLASGRRETFAGLDSALVARPRYRGYADACARVAAAA